MASLFRSRPPFWIARRSAPRACRPIQLRWHSGPLYRNTNPDRKEGESPATVTGQEPNSNAKPKPPPPNPHRRFYGTFAIPVAKVVLGTLITYQAAYWLWLKLGSIDEGGRTGEKLADLEKQLVHVVNERRRDSEP